MSTILDESRCHNEAEEISDHKSIIEAIQQVVEQKPDDWCQKIAGQAQRVVFVPSAHVGPYQGRYMVNRTLYLLFGARQPRGAIDLSPELSRSELLVRVTALADDTRLRILQMVSENQEMRSQEIMEALELSQPTTSRYLTQLTATGYLQERRSNTAKVYVLNPQRIELTLKAVAAFLIAKK